MPCQAKMRSVRIAPVKIVGIVERDLRRDRDERRAQGVLADRLRLGQPLGPGGAHVVGVDVVQQQRPLQEVVLGVADDHERDRGQREVLQGVDQHGEEAGDAGARGAGDVEDAGRRSTR